MSKTFDKTKALCLGEGALMLVLSVVLGFVKIFSMPLGEVVNMMALIPVIIQSYRWFNLGKFGKVVCVSTALLAGVVQLLIALPGQLALGLEPSKLALKLVLEYILAYTVFGFGGILRDKSNKGIIITSFVVGALAVVPWVVLCTTSHSEVLAQTLAVSKWFSIATAVVVVVITALSWALKDKIHQSGFGITGALAVGYFCRIVLSTVATLLTVTPQVAGEIGVFKFSVLYNLTYLVPEVVVSALFLIAFCAIIDMDAESINVRMKNNPVFKG